MDDQFQLEPGNGGDRDDYIQKHGIKTYLVVVPEVNIVYVLQCISKNILGVKCGFVNLYMQPKLLVSAKAAKLHQISYTL